MDMNAILPPEEPVTPAAPTADVTKPVTEPEVIPAGGEGEVNDDPDALDDFEYAGAKYKVAKSSREALAKAFDGLGKEFTHRSQTRAKELDEREQRIAEQAKAGDEELELRVQRRHVDQQLASYSKWTQADWAKLKADDPQSWNEHYMNVIALQNGKRDLDGKISEADGKRSQEAQSTAIRRYEEAEKFASTLIGWNGDSAAQLIDYVVRKGVETHKMEEQAVKALVHSSMGPLMIDLLHKARIGEEVLKRKAAPKPAAEDPKPLETVSSRKNPAPVGLDDRLPISEWMKRREAQVKRKTG